jgi:hypothetical protein
MPSYYHLKIKENEKREKKAFLKMAKFYLKNRMHLFQRLRFNKLEKQFPEQTKAEKETIRRVSSEFLLITL